MSLRRVGQKSGLLALVTPLCGGSKRSAVNCSDDICACIARNLSPLMEPLWRSLLVVASDGRSLDGLVLSSTQFREQTKGAVYVILIDCCRVLGEIVCTGEEP